MKSEKALFGLVGFLTWQTDTDEVITNNLPTKELKILVNMILVIKALLSYPLPYFASVELLESSLFSASTTNQIGSDHSIPPSKRRSNSMHSLTMKPLFTQWSCYDNDGDLKFWAVCLRIALIIFTLFLAIFIPHFAILMGLIGSITGTMLSLIWPCYFHFKLKRKTLKWYQCAVDLIIIFFGLIITFAGVYYSSIALFKAFRLAEKRKLADLTSFDKNYYKKNNFFLSMLNKSAENNYIIKQNPK